MSADPVSPSESPSARFDAPRAYQDPYNFDFAAEALNEYPEVFSEEAKAVNAYQLARLVAACGWQDDKSGAAKALTLLGSCQVVLERIAKAQLAKAQTLAGLRKEREDEFRVHGLNPDDLASKVAASQVYKLIGETKQSKFPLARYGRDWLELFFIEEQKFPADYAKERLEVFEAKGWDRDGALQTIMDVRRWRESLGKGGQSEAGRKSRGNLKGFQKKKTRRKKEG